MDARRALLAELIDDAGLFPPASLPMEEAAAGHDASRAGPHGWMLARFICPASRLRELLKALPDAPRPPWRVSILLDAAGPEPWLERMTADLLAAREFAEEAGSHAVVELVETAPAPDSVTELRRFVAAVEEARFPGPVTPFLEVPSGEAVRPVTALAEVRRETSNQGACRPPAAKLRCGGATAEHFPSPAAVAGFIGACLRLGVPFKATAGLHHPFRHVDAATGFTRHGFLNLVGATALARAHGLDAGGIEPVVAEDDPAAFSLTPERFAWRELEATPEQVAETRRALFVAYGSCSFSEPVDDLLALGRSGPAGGPTVLPSPAGPGAPSPWPAPPGTRTSRRRG